MGIVDQRFDHIDSGAFSPTGARAYFISRVDEVHLAAPDAGQRLLAHVSRLAAQQGQQRLSVRARGAAATPNRSSKRRVEVDRWS